jgi:membrane-associated phospholipid phosphatase
VDEPWWRTEVERELAAWVVELPDALEPILVVAMQVGTRWFCALAVVALVLAGRRRVALAVGLAGVWAWSATTLLKALVDAPRPTAATLRVLPRALEDGAGFPSTHTAMATALAVALLLGREPEDRPLQVAAVVAAVLAVLTAVARVHLGVHWPTDVVGGAIVGVVCGLLGALAMRSVERRSTARA